MNQRIETVLLLRLSAEPFEYGLGDCIKSWEISEDIAQAPY
jgi:hypothetical protein